MTLAIVTSAPHKSIDKKIYSYAPYIREMNIWTKYADKIIVIAPSDENDSIDEIDAPYTDKIELVKVKAFNINNVYNVIRTLIISPFICFKIYKVMKRADHIHMRCPCNMSLLGAFVQILFPKKKKTVKYAGNWDYGSRQPWTYRLQQNILKNTTLSKNIKVLVYGEWPNATANMVPFISATYRDDEKTEFKPKEYQKVLRFVFTASMVEGKRPMLTIKIIQKLVENGIKAEIFMFGDGPLLKELKDYVEKEKISHYIFLEGNQDRETIKNCLKTAHFSILPSKSEGWPKAIAEGMFFGTIPISTRISCLEWMLDYGNRGILIDSDVDSAVDKIQQELNKGDEYLVKLSESAMLWSQNYTLDKLDNEIGKLVIK